MKRTGVLLMLLIGVVAVVIFMKQSYYPPLPLENFSAKEVIEKLEQSNQEIAEIGVEAETIWYIMRNENEVEETIKSMITEKDWLFQEKDGAGLFFEKDGERLIVTTEMWSKKYVLVKVPISFR